QVKLSVNEISVFGERNRKRGPEKLVKPVIAVEGSPFSSGPPLKIWGNTKPYGSRCHVSVATLRRCALQPAAPRASLMMFEAIVQVCVSWTLVPGRTRLMGFVGRPLTGYGSTRLKLS